MSAVETAPQRSNINRDISHIDKKVISGMEFMSIGDEEYREYDIPTDDGPVVYQIPEPKWLFVRPSGAHMVLDSEGVMHYIKADFIALRWYNREDAPEANF